MFSGWYEGFKAALASKKFQGLCLGYAASVLVVVVWAAAKGFGLTIDEAIIEKAITGILALAGIHIGAQGVADGLSKGATSNAALTSFVAGANAAMRQQGGESPANP